MNKKHLLLVIIVLTVSFVLRLPPSSSKLAGYDQIQIFHNGPQLLQTSFTDFNELYKNTIVRLILYNYHGISNITLSTLNTLFLKATHLNVTWWSYFFIYHLFSTLTVLFIFLILKECSNNFKLSLLSALVWSFTPCSVISAMRPCWAPFSTFFSLLFLLIMILYSKKKTSTLILWSSLILSIIILGDLTFMINIFISIILIYQQRKKDKNLWSIKKIILFSTLPVTALIINLLSTLISLYKGYHIGLLGYIIGHKAQIKPMGLFHSYADFFQGLFWSNGFVLFLFVLLFFLIVFKLKESLFYQRLFFVWSLILLIPTLLLRRDDLTITLVNLPLTLLSCLYIINRNITEKKKTILLIGIIILQIPFLLNIKYNIFSIPKKYYKQSFKGEIAVGHKDHGQMAVGCWIEENVPKKDSVLIITPYSEDNFIKDKTKYHMKEMFFMVSTGLYGKKVYTQCKGLADKKLFSLCNLFCYRPKYNVESPPKYLIDYSNSNQINQIIHQFIPDTISYYKIAEITNKQKKFISIYTKKQNNKNTITIKKSDLEYLYLSKYSKIDDYIYSPYQGLWFFLP